MVFLDWKQLEGFIFTVTKTLLDSTLQIDFGEYNNDKARGSGPGSNPHHLVLQALDKFYPLRYRTNITAEQLRQAFKTVKT